MEVILWNIKELTEMIMKLRLKKIEILFKIW